MRLVKVNSRIVQAVGYDPLRSMLGIRFKISKRIYAYLDVPQQLYEAFLKARSKGSFFNQKIKYQFKAVLVKL